MRQVAVSLICLIFTVSAISQTKKTKRPTFYGGLGVGLDYGGLGVKLEFQPKKWLGFFGGAGYNFESFGTNAGLSFKGLPDYNSTPTIMIMYGYNSVMKVNSRLGTELFSETYYGFSAGAGYDFIVGKNRNKISIAIIVPFRGKDFKAQYDEFQEAGYSFSSSIPTVLISAGFNFAGYNR